MFKVYLGQLILVVLCVTIVTRLRLMMLVELVGVPALSATAIIGVVNFFRYNASCTELYMGNGKCNKDKVQ